MNKTFCDTKKHTFLTIPWYGWVSAVIILVIHLGLYKISVAINTYCPVWSGFTPKIGVIDNNIPFCPWFFIQIYYLSYFFWPIATLIISKRDKVNFINYMIELCLSSIFVFLLFVFVPTYQIRADDQLKEKVEAIKDPFTKALCNLMYFKLDGAVKSFNMAPSYHCLYSMFAFIGIMRQEKSPLYHKIWIGLFALCICLATMLVKQHYFMDFVSAGVVSVIFFFPFEFKFKLGERILKAKPNFLEIKNKKNTSGKH